MRVTVLLLSFLLLPIFSHVPTASAQFIEFGPVEERKPKRKRVRRPAPPPPPVEESAAIEELPAEPENEPADPPAPPPPATARATPTTKQPSSTAAMPPPPAPANCKNTGKFSTWLAGFKREAAANGVSSRTINRALDGVWLNRKVISRDRRQGIFSISFEAFVKKLATLSRVKAGRRQIKRNQRTFDRATQEFGVPPSVITGFWALESDFGAGMGNLRVLPSLATLAYDCRRGPMFRAELMAALKIIDRGDMNPEDMIGSWAGELGQTQFLPTRYLEHAIDYNGDGKANLFQSDTDIIGSTANYMNHLGWQTGQPWLQEAQLTQKLPWREADLAIKHPLSQWAKWGVKLRGGKELPVGKGDLNASLLLPMGRHGPVFLAYENFDIYLKWNQSLNYAITAAYLATRIDGAPPMDKGRGNIPVLSDPETREMQRRLVAMGYDVGEVDGKVGAMTRAAVKEVQLKYGLPADSYPTPELLSELRRRR